MHPKTLRKISVAMCKAGVPKHMQDIVHASLLAETPEDRADVAWAALLDELQTDRRSIMGNLSTRPAYLREHYLAYISIMDKVRERMLIAQSKGTPEDARRAAAIANAQREQEGKPVNGTDSNTWVSWVPPRVREQLCAAVSQAYVAAGSVRGKRFVPFTSTAKRRELKQRTDNLTKTIKRVRSTHESFPNSGRAYTPYRALYLCAARMAEKELYRRLKAYELGTQNPIDNPLPVNWLALLDAPMRQRLRQAQENPHAVSPEGLAHFYEAPRGADAAEDALPPELLDADIAHAQDNPLPTEAGLEGLTEEGDDDGAGS